MWNLHLPAERRPRRWLCAGGSLTAHLKREWRDFRVLRVFQGAAMPYADEAAAIGLEPGCRAVVRDVLLHGEGRPLVFGHSTLRRGDLRGPWRALGDLGHRPLAEALFVDRSISREPLHFRRLARSHPLHRRVEAVLRASLPPLWARRSLFRREGAPLLVTEVFLPDLWSLRQAVSPLSADRGTCG